ncbi:hypothetical protein ASD63_32095 [Ensifer sp. Root558]|nr:hypothetical protein ASD63_32095 [Ensifer sp. Root558]OKP74496.1 hypothetical protein BTE77_21470 [Ensifer adhaerens]SFH55543.1 hypothetical protein SAMN05216459_1495 [Ensifer sp. OV372]
MPTEVPIPAATPDEAEAIVETAPVEVEPPRATEPVASLRRKPSKQQAREVQNVALAAGVAHGAANSEPRGAPIVFIDEVVALDEDITQLRRQLAQKLSLQNAQLKKLLERF